MTDDAGPEALPPSLAAALDALGVGAPPPPPLPLPPLSRRALMAVRTGLCTQWRPRFPGDEPPF